MQHFATVETELHRVYGVDVWDRYLMESRPWPWLSRRIWSLLELRTRLRWEAYGKADQDAVEERMAGAGQPLPWC